MNSDERHWSDPNCQDNDRRNERRNFYNERSAFNHFNTESWDDQLQTGRYDDRSDNRYDHTGEWFDAGQARYNDPNQWARYDENRCDFEYHPEHYSRPDRAPMRYNERPWPLDRFVEKMERGWNDWVNRDYSRHTPDSDFSW